ncbi:hypothetical protein DYH56_15465 [Psychrilyobacter piezotolerans]|uniref:Uncharacterized protein n=1 Tax=Psychrilyobacter piezotolerans TaxID=2293438 RepID=A0ABX9KCT0_9FUSO|nr:hypothetical protein DV867_15465 [Psychrilyobacter sp. S5]REI39260.1 hypothetical protein DYH56_15465 [Psychrilyobacter piezotolerans]
MLAGVDLVVLIHVPDEGLEPLHRVDEKERARVRHVPADLVDVELDVPQVGASREGRAVTLGLLQDSSLIIAHWQD